MNMNSSKHTEDLYRVRTADSDSDAWTTFLKADFGIALTADGKGLNCFGMTEHDMIPEPNMH